MKESSHAQMWAIVTLAGHDVTFSRRSEVDQAEDIRTQAMEFNVPLDLTPGET
jgi:hypothetical protein